MGRINLQHPFSKRGVHALICVAACGFTAHATAAEFQAASVAELKSAINQANANPDADTISISSSFEVNAADSAGGNTAFPAITSTVTIAGQGAGATIIERADIAPEFRFFKVTSEGDLTLEGVTLKGGYLSHSQEQDNTGGAINTKGKLTVNEASFVNNAADAGGAIANLDGGTLTVSDSTFTANQTTWHYAEGDGGAILNENGDAIIERSTFEKNSTRLSDSGIRKSDGGAIENSMGQMLVKDSTFVGNISYCGGAIENAIGKLVVVNSTFKDNIGTLHAGAIYGSRKRLGSDSSDFGDGLIEIHNSTISENEAGKEGGGAVFMDAGLAVISNSILANNIAKFENGELVPDRQDCGYTNDGNDYTGNIIVSGTNLISDAGCLVDGAAPDGETSTVITQAAGSSTDIAALQWNANAAAGEAHYAIGDNSLAIGQGTACDMADQLGTARAEACDLGAVENQTGSASFIGDDNLITIAGGVVVPVYERNSGSSEDTSSSSTSASDDQAMSDSTAATTTSAESSMAADSGGSGAFNPLLFLLAIPALIGSRRRK